MDADLKRYRTNMSAKFEIGAIIYPPPTAVKRSLLPCEIRLSSLCLGFSISSLLSSKNRTSIKSSIVLAIRNKEQIINTSLNFRKKSA